MRFPVSPLCRVLPCRVPATRSCRAGFTLSELLVAVAVASIMIAIVYQVFITQQRVFTTQEDVAEAQQNARVAVDTLTRYLSPIGANADVEKGQVRILMAHENELLFTADLSPDHQVLPTGTDLTTLSGYTAADPYDTVPGTYAITEPAETYRLYLRPDPGLGAGAHHSLMREINLTSSGSTQVAMFVANERVGQALFNYWGDFDGDGTFETLERVDQTTSPLVAAGAPLDSVIRRVDVQVITETPFPDPRLATNDGYRQTVLRTSITPRNMWDCPVIRPVPHSYAPLRAPTLGGVTTPLSFRVTRGAVAEQGRTVLFTVDGPPGFVDTTDQGTTDADGYVTTGIAWPLPTPPCATLPTGTYTVTATTSPPPSLDTPFGTCAPDSAHQEVTVIDGEIAAVQFTAGTLQVATCGDSVSVDYSLRDGCDRVVDPADVGADQVWFADPTLDGSADPETVPEGEPSGTVIYTSFPNAFDPTAPRTAAAPFPFATALQARLGGTAGPLLGETEVEIYPLPETITGLTVNLSGTGALFSDCPSSVGLNTETFQVNDVCSNPLYTLNGSYLGTTHSVEGRLESAFTGGVGGLTSTNNAVVPASPISIRENTGTDGEFDVAYVPPTCGLGDMARGVELVLTPSWDPGNPAGPVGFQVQPCTSCAVQVLDPLGTVTTSLNRECEPEYDVVVTHCEDPGPATVELVLEPILGTTPSFDPFLFTDRITLDFDRTSPPGGVQQATARLYMGWADARSRFRLTAYMPDQATVLGGLDPSAVICQSEPVDVDTSCEELLISDTPSNRGVYRTPSDARDTTICALEGAPVFFRVKDCDQNWRDYAADDILNLRGTIKGIRVEARDFITKAIIDEEQLDVLFEVNRDGLPGPNSSYFQGSLLVTQDPFDPVNSGLIKVPEGQVVELRASYRDPDDTSDANCETFALLVPPLPVCLPFPVMSFDGWDGDLLVRGGDAVVAGALNLPATPQLVGKDEFVAIDRFFNAYVGEQIFVNGTPAGVTGPVGQPLDLHPNYFQLVPDTASLLTRLDYSTLKTLARARRVYWEPDPASGLLVNPLRDDPATGQPLQGTFQQVTQLSAPGASTLEHPGSFLFIDAPAGLQSAGAIDAADTADLPRYSVIGDYYTEGLIYVAGSVELGPVGGGQPLDLIFEADRDAAYNEADGGFTRTDLPFDFDPTTGPSPAPSRPVHWNGVLYADGEVSLVGNPVLYGVLVAERGVQVSGDAEVWYDPSWMDTRLEQCTECCGLSLSPASPTAFLGAPLQLTANRPQGQVVWASLNQAVAVVDNFGEVEALTPGTAVIRATDAAGCVAEVEVEVSCGLELISSEGTDLVPGDLTNISAQAAQGVVTWVSDNPAALELDRGTGVSVLGTAMGIGGSQVTAIDTVTTSAGPAECVATLDFVVNCPGDHTLIADTLEPAIGATLTLTVVDGVGVDVSGPYTFFANGVILPGPSFTPTDLTTVELTARLPHDTCPVGPLTATPRCPDLVLAAAPNPATLTDTVVLSVRELGAETDSIGFTFAAEPPTLASVAGELLTPLGIGQVTVSASDSLGCAPPDLTLSLVCPGGRAITTDPTQPAPGDTVTLVVSGGNTGDYTFTADGLTLPVPSYTFVGQTPVTFGATLDGGTCPLSAVVTPACAPTTVVPVATSGNAGDAIGLTVLDGAGTDVTAGYTFTVSGPGTLTGNNVELTGVGTVQIGAGDGFGCTATGAAIEVTTP